MKALVAAAFVLTIAILAFSLADDDETDPNRSATGPEAIGAAVEDVAPPSTIRNVPQGQWADMIKARMVRPECPVRERRQLRRVDLNFINFDGEVERGHLIVRADTAQSVKRIFDRLYQTRFPIRMMVGVERFNGDVAASLKADNTSAFNCRRAAQINAPFAASPHANGRAVDINPVENPWKDLRCNCWTPSAANNKRTVGPGKILEGDATWRLFKAEGWIWQNIDVPDYMHFDTGYPSARLPRP